MVHIVPVPARHPLDIAPCHLTEATHLLSRHVTRYCVVVVTIKNVPVVTCVPLLLVHPEKRASHYLGELGVFVMYSASSLALRSTPPPPGTGLWDTTLCWGCHCLSRGFHQLTHSAKNVKSDAM